ncbi:MAG: polyamine aminopropyltransferase [Deltaproteobacteria bacterium]|nr:polyamine aminopropyltransferase [Deltaproteobacteria bacterium]
MTEEQQWVTEKWQDVETRYSIQSVLYEDCSEFQHSQIVESIRYGRMLLLDGIVQTTEKDEFIYHEMMVHVPMLSHPDPQKVLIIGGGDGGILREVLRHKTVSMVTMVEIDRSVIDLSREYLPTISKGAFKDSRTNIVISDGAAFVKETNEKFDVVIVDSSDPIGPATVLFSKGFYSDIHGSLTENGIMVCQTGSLFMQPDEQVATYSLLSGIYGFTRPYVFAVPTYIGGFFSAMFCSDIIDPDKITKGMLEEKAGANNLITRYYNPGMHIGAFHVPGFLRERLV